MKRLEKNEIKKLISAIDPLWRLNKNKQLSRTFEFENFLKALTFVNRIGKEAEVINHHPDIKISWNQVTLTLETHLVKGLTEADFKLASTIDSLSKNDSN